MACVLGLGLGPGLWPGPGLGPGLEEAADGLRLLLVHGGLVGEAHLLQVLPRVKVR